MNIFQLFAVNNITPIIGVKSNEDGRQKDLKNQDIHDKYGNTHEVVIADTHSKVFEELHDVVNIDIREKSKKDHPTKKVDFNEVEVVSAKQNLYYDM